MNNLGLIHFLIILMQHRLMPYFSHKSILPAFIFSTIAAIFFAIAPAHATGVYDLPALSSGSSTWVIDSADAISLANEGKLSGELKNLAEKTDREVRLIAIRRLDYGETIESFADKVFSSWFPTPEERANQTILAIDTLTNSSAIRTGEAVKTVMSDEIADSVVSETIAASLRNGSKYNQAFLDASNRLVAVLSGQPDPGPPTVQDVSIEGTFASAEETDDRNATVWVIVLLVLATAIPMATYFWYVGFPGNS